MHTSLSPSLCIHICVYKHTITIQNLYGDLTIISPTISSEIKASFEVTVGVIMITSKHV